MTAAWLILSFVLAFSPVWAQDIEATPIVIDGGIPDSGDDTIIVPVPMPVPVEPEPSPELPESVQLAIVVGIAAFAIVALILYANHRKLTPQQAFQGLPGIITQYGFPAVWSFLYDRARATVDPADDVALKEAARFAGYRVTEMPNGAVMLERDPAHFPPPVPPVG